MAKVQAKVMGGTIKEIEAITVGEVKQKLGVQSHTATVNGETAGDDYELSDFQFVTLAPAVKGGC